MMAIGVSGGQGGDFVRVGVVVFSQTGNTLSVAQKIIERLRDSGTEAVLERIKPIGELKPTDKIIRFESLPELNQYDAFVFASPVQAFSLAPAMSQYIPQAAAFNGKKAVLFATEFFPFPWMGGNRALGQMEALLKAKGASTAKAGVVNWSNGRREELLQETVDNAVRLLLV
jgi:flavodoxin